MADTWVAPFYNGAVCFDAQAKEVVKVTNGQCVRPHDSEHYDGHMENGGCTFTPHEAVALRVIGRTPHTKKGNGDPIVAFTYRGVRAEALTVIDADRWIEPSTFRRSRFIGRV